MIAYVWRTTVGVALAAASVLGVSGPALAGKSAENDPIVQPASGQGPVLLEELWQQILHDLPTDLKALMQLRAVDHASYARVNAYLDANWRIWRLLPRTTLERVLAEGAVTQAWKTAITTHVLVDDVPRSDVEQAYTARARVVEDQRELDVALADSVEEWHTINVRGDGTFDFSGVTEKMGWWARFRLHGSVQVFNPSFATTYAYDTTQVHNVSGSAHVDANDYSEVHGVTDTGNVQALGDAKVFNVATTNENRRVKLLGRAQLHGMTAGIVLASESSKIFGLTDGAVWAHQQTEIIKPTGGTIHSFGPGVNIIDPSPAVHINPH